MRRPSLRVLLAGTVLLAGAPVVASAAPDDDVLRLSGQGLTVEVSTAPFGITVVDDRTGVRLQQLADDGSPARVTMPGPQPENPVGDTGGHGPLSFTVGGSVLTQHPGGPYSGNDFLAVSGGAVYGPTSVVDATPSGNGHVLRLATDAPGSPLATLELRFVAPGQLKVAFQPPQTLPVTQVGDAFASPSDERFFGFGARKNAVDQRGRLLHSYLQQENTGEGFPNGPTAAYYSQNLFLSSKGYGVTVDDTRPTTFDMASSRDDAYRFAVLGKRLEYTLQFGGDLTEVLTRMAQRNGLAPLLPRWALEPWIDNQVNAGNLFDPKKVITELEDTERQIEANNLPVGVIGIEGWGVAKDAGIEKATARLTEKGYKLSGYQYMFYAPTDLAGRVDPAFFEGQEMDIFVKNAAGETYFINNTFGQSVAIVDFTHPDALTFWQRQVTKMLDLGFDAWMLDFGEQVQDAMVFHDGRTGREMHNAYPIEYARVTKQAVDEYAKARGLDPAWFYMRSGFTGSVAHTGGTFPGDESSDFGRTNGLPSVIPSMLNMAAGGVPFFTTDVGGYFASSEQTKELYTRWVQMGAFSPVMRIHAYDNVFPWDYDAETVDFYRTYATLHRALGDYLYGYAQEASATGMPIARPLYLTDPTAPEEVLRQQYLLGEDLLVAPVVGKGATEWPVYLPRGEQWQQLQVDPAGCLRPVGSVLDGGTSLTVSAPLSDTPVFLRHGAANPAPCR